MRVEYRTSEMLLALEELTPFFGTNQVRAEQFLEAQLREVVLEERERCINLLLQRCMKFGDETILGQQLREVACSLSLEGHDRNP